jgi:hypothetical protein
MNKEVTINVSKKKLNQLVKTAKQALHDLELENIDHNYLTFGGQLPIKPTLVVIGDLKKAIENLSK